MASPGTLSLLLILLSLSAFSSSLDMSIITYDRTHKIGGLVRSEDEVMALYESWLVKQGKTYNPIGEKERRFQIFEDNMNFIDEHNSFAGRPYRLGLNRFADVTNEEYRLKYVGRRLDRKSRLMNSASERYAFKEGDKLPESVDWREKGAIAPVKDQGQCGICWTFWSVAAVEGVNQIVTGEMIVLAEQELVDCDKTYNQGCNGGLMDLNLSLIMVVLAQRKITHTVLMTAHVTLIGKMYTKTFQKMMNKHCRKLWLTNQSVLPMKLGADLSNFTDQVSLLHSVAVGYGTENGTDY